MVALCSAAVGCGDDDDYDNSKAGTGGKGGSGGGSGKGGSGGKGGAGGAKVATKAECIESFDKATPLPSACVECACDANTAVVAACGDECWALIACVTTKCADVLTDMQATNACAGTMCATEVNAAGPAMMLGPATMVGPILQSPACSAKCGAGVVPLPPEGDASVGGEDGGVDAGS